MLLWNHVFWKLLQKIQVLLLSMGFTINVSLITKYQRTMINITELKWENVVKHGCVKIALGDGDREAMGIVKRWLYSDRQRYRSKE